MISNATYQAIAALDLEPIKLKLMHRSGQGWNQARAEAIAIEYRRFLYLQHAYQDEATAPTLDVDTFWHYHILDTMKYAADCEQLFGYFLHHYPCVGLLDGDEEGAEIAAGERTRVLYEATFGEPYIRADAYGVDGNGVVVDQAQLAPQAKCPVASPDGEAKSASATARCNVFCAVAQPKSEPKSASATARCNVFCAVSKPKTKVKSAAATARCNVFCAVAKPQTQAKSTAATQRSACIGGEPKAALSSPSPVAAHY